MSVNIFESQFPLAPVAAPIGEAPPPYSTLPATATDMAAMGGAWGGPPVSIGHNPVGMKLAYMDFVPQLVKKRLIGKNEYDTFSSLIQRANTWLEDHLDLELISCETVTWFGSSPKEIFSDSTQFRKSGVTTFLSGIRLWYMTRLVPSPGRSVSRRCNILNCHTVPARPSETFTQLLSRVNDLINNQGTGKVISVEAVRMHVSDDTVNLETTVWREDVTDTKHVIYAFRVFTQLLESKTRQTIGYQDFIPSRTNRSKENKGYELYADVMDRAARWIARQQGVRFINLQTLSLKIKKVADQSFAERCSFTEHGRRTTNFLSVIRTYFVIDQSESRVEPPPAARLTYRMFNPAQITYATATTPAEFEDTRNLLERINQWLQKSGAALFSLETIPCRQTVGQQQTLGTEATFIPNQDGSSPSAKYLFHIRIYLHGDYVDPGAAASPASVSHAHVAYVRH